MAQQVLRFGITDGKGHRAATWRLWTETGKGKSEVYLAARSLGGTLKASLHESGKWHNAYTQHAFERDVEGAITKQKDRFLEKWPRPKDIAPGITLAFRIVTPWSSTTSPIEESKTKNVIWLPNAPKPKSTEIDVIFTKPTVSVPDWPGSRSMGTELIGSILLENKETVWAVYWIIDTPDFSPLEKGTGGFYKGKSRKDLESDSIRALVFGTEPDGSRTMYDCAVDTTAINKSDKK